MSGFGLCRGDLRSFVLTFRAVCANTLPHRHLFALLKQGSTFRRIFFRVGEFCYHGQLDTDMERVPTLADVPVLIPLLQKQQGKLSYLQEIDAVRYLHQGGRLGELF